MNVFRSRDDSNAIMSKLVCVIFVESIHLELQLDRRYIVDVLAIRFVIVSNKLNSNYLKISLSIGINNRVLSCQKRLLFLVDCKESLVALRHIAMQMPKA